MAEVWGRARAALPPAALGLLAVWLARDFPPVPGQVYGPGLFPTVLGLLLVACAIGVALQAATKPGDPATRGARVAALSYALAPAVLVAGWETLGWPLLATGLGAWLLRVGGVSVGRSVIGGLAIAALTWVLFPMLLRVPLPRGPLPFLPY